MKKEQLKKSKGLEPFVDTKDLCHSLGVSPEWVKEAKRTKGLPYYKIGRLVKFRISEVEQWLKERHVS